MSDTTKTEASPSSPTDRRRSSGAFANLHNQKRGSMDEAAQARRASIQEQMPKSGFLGNMWNSWARGHTSDSKPTTAGTMPKQSIHRTGAGTLG